MRQLSCSLAIASICPRRIPRRESRPIAAIGMCVPRETYISVLRAATLDLEKTKCSVVFGFAHVVIECNRLTYYRLPSTKSQGG